VKHQERIWVCHNAALDFHLIRKVLEETPTPANVDALEWWMQVVDECRLRDVFVLDALIRLGLEDGSTKPRPLLEILSQYTGLDLMAEEQRQVVNTTHYRVGQRWYEDSVTARFVAANRVEQHLLDSLAQFAVRDTYLLQRGYDRMLADAHIIMDMYKEEIFPSGPTQYGPLTEGIQVKGNIVLCDITKNGFAVDVSLVDRVRGKMEARLNAAIAKLQDNPEWGGLFHLTVQDGKIAPIRERGKPSIILARLEELLLKAASEITDKYSIDVTLPVGQGGKKVSLSTKVWYAMKSIVSLLSLLMNTFVLSIYQERIRSIP
jgi:hypothetical protein